MPVGGGAPVVVQSMTKTDTSDVEATVAQIGRMVDAGCELVRVAVPRDKDAVALETIVKRSPVPVIADIHFNHTLALKAIDAGAHCIRLNPGNIGGREKVEEVARQGDRRRRADADRRQLGLAAQAPPRARARPAGRGARHRRGRVRDFDGGPRLRELQGLDQVHERAQHDRRQPAAVRADRLPAAPRRDRERDALVRLAEVGGRARARCWQRASATRSGSRSPPSTPRRR